jgi:hypothetical protein
MFQEVRQKLQAFFTWLLNQHGLPGGQYLQEIDAAMAKAESVIASLEARVKTLEDLVAAGQPKS